MKKLSILFAVLLSGCMTVPVTAKFPAKPEASEACPELARLPDQPVISDVTTTVVKNYGTYYECSVKVDTWNEWYDKQKKIFESIK